MLAQLRGQGMRHFKTRGVNMRKIKYGQWLLASALLFAMLSGMAAPDEVTAEQVVNALEGAFGITPGVRRNHVKGTCALGEFVGSPAMSVYSRSALFSGNPAPVIARFSLAGGNPNVADAAKSGRGMALEFSLPGGVLQHMTMLNTPVFGAARPRTFLDMMMAIRPDPATGKPNPEKISAFKAAHPDSLAQSAYLASNNPPVSYSSSSYWGIHTFRFLNRDNRVTPVRWRFVPQDGEKRLTDDELKSFPHDFLERALISRIREGVVRWDMMVSIGEPGDPQDDPTLTWPDSRRQIKAGTLTLSSVMPQQGAECEKINFDPLVMSDGIEPSGDPVLLFRSQAYAVSFARRMSGH